MLSNVRYRRPGEQTSTPGRRRGDAHDNVVGHASRSTRRATVSYDVNFFLYLSEMLTSSFSTVSSPSVYLVNSTRRDVVVCVCSPRSFIFALSYIVRSHLSVCLSLELRSM